MNLIMLKKLTFTTKGTWCSYTSSGVVTGVDERAMHNILLIHALLTVLPSYSYAGLLLSYLQVLLVGDVTTRSAEDHWLELFFTW